jgi:ribosomal protein L37AE/L43A
MKNRKHARVYHGRHKGSTETHIPNDDFRKKFEEMKWESYIPYECPCGHEELVHKTEHKIHRCTKCGE